MTVLSWKRQAWIARLAGAAAAVIVSPAWAQVPEVVDRVPKDALVVASIKNLGELKSEFDRILGAVNMPAEATGLGQFMVFLDKPGVNAAGSAAMAVLPGEEGPDGEPPMIAFIPVSDFAAFAKGFAGVEADGLQKLTVEDDEVYARSLEGGYAAMSDRPELLKALGEGGSRAAFEAMLGEVGKQVADGADLLFIANIPALAPMLKEQYDQQRAGMPVPEEQQEQMAFVDATVEEFLRDAQVGVLGFDASEGGLRFDAAAQFKEGSPLAERFVIEGEAGRLIGRLPSMPYYFAAAMDTSSAPAKAMIRDFSKLNARAAAEMPGLMEAFTKSAETIDGVAFLLGTSPALMGGGIFTNFVEYVQTSQPQEFVQTVQQALTQLDNQKLEGVTYDTSFQPDAADVNGSKAAAWSMRMQFDPTNPEAQQAQFAQTMIFGPTGGPAGYLLPVENGVVMTFKKDANLAKQAAAAAASGQGLSAEAGLKQVQSQLPSGRAFEGYIGAKHIIETVVGFAAMAAGPIEGYEVPAELPPVGVGGTLNTGALRASVFVPMQVITTVSELRAAMDRAAGGEMMDEAPEEEAGQPRF